MLIKLLKRGLKHGQITIITPDNMTHVIGSGLPAVTWKFNNLSAMNRILRNWEFELGETYAEFGWDVTEGSLQDLLALLRASFSAPRKGFLGKIISNLDGIWKAGNSLTRSKTNVASHYDLDAQLFSQFLDPDMNYSCAYHDQPQMTLTEAQHAKCAHLSKKLIPLAGQRILDIGCGWGSLAIFLAENFDVEVHGITLSEEQFKVAKKRIVEKGLEKRVEISLRDYREIDQRYNRIVSVGMFEHVGKAHYQAFFDQLEKNLTEDGIAVLHTIGRTGVPAPTNPWIQKYIFPGGYIPALSDVSKPIEKSDLMLTDLEVLRQHYNQTVAFWREGFSQKRAQFVALKGEKFCRIWEFYLSISEVVFSHSDTVVFQFQFARQHQVVPNTRDYLYQAR